MPPRRRVAVPPPIDVDSVRRNLADGKIVRVGISRSAQFPDGGTGRVRSVGNPETDGDEYVQVELSLNGTKDILPFTPSDLTPATRGRPPGSGRKAAPADAASAVDSAGAATDPPAASPSAARMPAATGERTSGGRPSGERIPRPPSVPQTSTDDSRVTEPPGAPRSAPGPRPLTNGTAGTTAPTVSTALRSAAEGAGAGAPGSQRAESFSPPDRASDSKARAARGARRPPAVSITVATTPSEPTQWRIEARIGTKIAVKATAVSPARVWELVQTLDNEPLSRAVGSILDEQRSTAQARADALAAELAAVQAELEALPNAHG